MILKKEMFKKIINELKKLDKMELEKIFIKYGFGKIPDITFVPGYYIDESKQIAWYQITCLSFRERVTVDLINNEIIKEEF